MNQCKNCEGTIALAQSVVHSSTVKLNEASEEIAKLRRERDEARAELDKVSQQVDELVASMSKFARWMLQ